MQHSRETSSSPPLDNPSVSFIIEWDNARLSELGRARQMLKMLQIQIAEMENISSKPAHLVILYNNEEIDSVIIYRVIAESMTLPDDNLQIDVIAAEGMHYYELKNKGLTYTDREVIIYLDSDTIPEPGWLHALMTSICKSGVEIVGGNTYVSPENFLGKAFNLFWFFDLRSSQEELHVYNKFYANNVAVRRHVLEAHPFPQMDAFRGQCALLSEELQRNGIAIYRHSGARLEHPVPNGLTHLYHRAICEGHDQMTTHRWQRSGKWETSPGGAVQRFRQRLKSNLKRASDHYKEVGLSKVGAVAATAVGASYCVLMLFGELVTYYRPEMVRRHWPI